MFGGAGNMNIRMYDCGFGDCFRLRNENENDLYVDFGIHSNSMQGNHDAYYDRIINDMNKKVDFLLTHYHDDHYAGAVYMSENTDKRFTNVYVPDIWNINGSVELVFLYLLRGILTKTVIRKNLTLFDFLKAICTCDGYIHFIKRNSIIQNNYIALWPSEDYMKSKVENKINDALFEDNKNGELMVIAKRLVRTVVRLSDTYGKEGRTQIINDLEDMSREYDTLSQNYSPDKNLQYRLTNFGNGISVVFQNKFVKDRGVLFTGDVRKEVWTFVEKNKDGKIEMHEKYNVIKIPHHGTKPYYHSFVNYLDKNAYLLIPNGEINRNNSWYISSKYSVDANKIGCKVICANNQACKSAMPNCTCVRCDLACNKNYYTDILEEII